MNARSHTPTHHFWKDSSSERPSSVTYGHRRTSPPFPRDTSEHDRDANNSLFRGEYQIVT